MHARPRAHHDAPEPTIALTRTPGRVSPPTRPAPATATAPATAVAPATAAVVRRPAAPAVLPPVALSLALGLWGLRRGGSLWRDEAVTYDMAHRSLPDLWATIAHADAVHGLYYLLLHALSALSETAGGADPLLVLRLPSVLATAAATGTLALLGHRLAGTRAGLLSGAVFAMLPPVQRYAQEGRSYALVCALVIWASYLLLRAVRVRGGRAWLAYGAVALAACLLHEFAVLVLPAHLVTLPAPARRTGTAVMAAVCLCLTPLAVLSMRQSDQVAWIGGVGAGAVLGFAGVGVLGLGCAALLAVRRSTGPARRASRGAGAWALRLLRGSGGTGLPVLALPLLLIPPLLLLLVSLVKPLYVDRYVLYAQAGTALLVGAALDRLLGARGRTRTAARLAAGTAVLALLPVTLDLRTPHSRTDDVTAVAEAVRAAERGADGIVYMPSRRRIWSLPDPTPFRGLRDLALDSGPVASHTLYGTELPAAVVRDRMLAATRIVALRDPAGQPVDRVAQETVKRRVLASRFEECATWRVRGARVTVYARPGRC